MAQLDRRSFVGALLALPAGLATAEARIGVLFLQADDRALLRALARAVLPEELDGERIAELAQRFEQWISNYRAGAELDHGYGTGELRYAPADPWPNWRVQLHRLEAEARAQFSTGFGALPVERSRALVAGQIEAAAGDRLPTALTAPHVALALLAWFYDSPEATDLCYRSAIGRQTCRPLADTANLPRPS